MDSKAAYLNGNSMQNVNRKTSSVVIVAMFVFLGICLFFGIAEAGIAFIRNSHIMGFVFGAVLFVVALITMIIFSLYLKKGKFYGAGASVVYALAVLCLILLGFVIAFLTVKILNYSQPNTNQTDQKIYDFFSEDCIRAAEECTKITPQSRVEHTAVINDGAVFYVQTSHTDTFLGRITDGVYKFFPLVPPSESNDDPQPVCNAYTPMSTCVLVDCSKRIGGKEVECGKFRDEFIKCLQENDQERFNKCPKTS